jgi:predicted RNase H-like HicB family nuclease
VDIRFDASSCPQAISQRQTKKEALDNIKEAIELVLEYREERERGKKVELEVAV